MSKILIIALTIIFLLVLFFYYKNDNKNTENFSRNVKNCLTLSGGGFTAFSADYAFLTYFLIKKAKKDKRVTTYADILKNIGTLSGISGSTWFYTMLLYNREFYNVMNSISIDSASVNSQKVADHYWNNYMKKCWMAKNELSTAQGSVENYTREYPFWVSLILGIASKMSQYNILANSWADVVNNIVFLNFFRNRTIPISNCLQEFREKNILFGSAIMTSGRIDSNETYVSYTINPPMCNKYNLTYNQTTKKFRKEPIGNAPNSLTYPCLPGPGGVGFMGRDRDSIMNFEIVSNGKLLSTPQDYVYNRSRVIGPNNRDDVWITPTLISGPTNSSFDNTLFDTCGIIDEMGAFPIYDPVMSERLGRNVTTNLSLPIRGRVGCWNVGAADCCRNNWENSKCPVIFPVLFSNKRENKLCKINTNIPIQYTAYNTMTEKNPAILAGGENLWAWEFAEPPAYLDSYRHVKYLRDYLTPSIINNFNISSVPVNAASIASSAAGSFFLDPCGMKSSFYVSGSSVQEDIMNDVLYKFNRYSSSSPILVNYMQNGRNTLNIFDSVNDLTRKTGESFVRKEENSEIKNLVSFNNNMTVSRLSDGGFCDNTGIINSILVNQQEPPSRNIFKIIHFNVKPYWSSTANNPIHTDIRLLFRNYYVNLRSNPQEIYEEILTSNYILPTELDPEDQVRRRITYETHKLSDIPDIYKIISSVAYYIRAASRYSTAEEAGLITALSIANTIIITVMSLLLPFLSIDVVYDFLLELLGMPQIEFEALLEGLVILLISSFDVAAEIIDLDRDNHLEVDNYGKRYSYNDHIRKTDNGIFQGNWEDAEVSEFKTADSQELIDQIFMVKIKYKRLTTMKNDTYGIRAGDNVELIVYQMYVKDVGNFVYDNEKSSFMKYSNIVSKGVYEIMDKFDNTDIESEFNL
jgi:hypothetical protein